MTNKIDIHYATQRVMKGWLLVHVPLTMGMMMLTLWHIIVVHVYAL